MTLFSKFVLVTVGFSFISAFSAQAVITDGVTPDENYVKLGKLFPAVGYGSWEIDGERVMFSGTLVKPDLIMTAAHPFHDLCRSITVAEDELLPKSFTFPLSDLFFSFEEILSTAHIHSGESSVAVESVSIHPYYLPNIEDPQTSKGCDVAFLKLSSPVENIDPLPLLRGAFGDFTSPVIVGYGPGDEGMKHSRRAALLTPLEQETGGYLYSRYYDLNESPRTGFTSLARWSRFAHDSLSRSSIPQGAVQRGDSGGPVLVNTRDGFKCVGVISGVGTFVPGRRKHSSVSDRPPTERSEFHGAYASIITPLLTSKPGLHAMDWHIAKLSEAAQKITSDIKPR